MIIHSIAGLMWKTYCKISKCFFFEPYERSAGNADVESDLSYYTTKDKLNEGTGNNTSKLAAETDLAILKTKVDKLDVGKIKVTTYTNLYRNRLQLLFT